MAWTRIAGRTVAAAVMVIGIALPRASSADNLTDALVGAYNTSGILEQNRALLRAADEDVATAVAALRPIINFTANIDRIYTSNKVDNVTRELGRTPFFVGLTGDLLLYDGGGSKLGIQAAKETVLATRDTLLAVEQDILFRAVAAYVNVLLQQENVDLRENNVRVLMEEQRAAQDRFDVGEVTRTDVALAESRVAASRSELAQARGALVDARAEYMNAVGRDPGIIERRPPLPTAPASLTEAQALAARNHPDIQSAQRQVSAADLNVRRAETALGPTARIRADVGFDERFGETDYNRNASIGVTMSQPIYRGGALGSGIRSARATRDATRANLITVQRNIAQEVANAFVRLETARATIVATDERVRAAQVAFDGVREEATLGARTTLDVLQSEQELLDALTSQLSARAEFAVASYQLLSAQGLLTAARLRLPVQIYDPTIYYNLAKDAPVRTSKQSRDLDRVLEALGRD
jgi:outer membrane protein